MKPRTLRRLLTERVREQRRRILLIADKWRSGPRESKGAGK